MARAAPPVPENPDKALEGAYVCGLRLLSGRELSESALKTRLAARGFRQDTVEAAAARLTRVGALSEQRAVRAVARTLIQVKRRGRLRAQRELEAKGFSKRDSAAALAELLAGEDEHALVERALDARLRSRRIARGDAAAMRRLYSALIRQGFAPSAVGDAVRRRFRLAPAQDDDPDAR